MKKGGWPGFLIVFAMLFAVQVLHAQWELDPCTKASEPVAQPRLGFSGVAYDRMDASTAEKACRSQVELSPGDVHAKALLARALTKAEKYEEAFRFVRDACNAGDDLGCTLLGVYYYNAYLPRVKIDLGKAEQLWTKACSHGYPVACLNLAQYKIKFPGFFGSIFGTGKAEALMFKACSGGFDDACRYYANAVYFDKITPKEGHYLTAARRSCESGLDCTYYTMLQSESKVQISFAEAFRTFKKACENGSAESCRTLGSYYYGGGEGVPKDDERALAYFRKACDGGDIRFGCWYAGVLRYNSDVDKKAGLALMTRACNEGENTFACYDLAKIYLSIPALAPDRQRAVELLRYACKRGNVRSCEALDRLKKR